MIVLYIEESRELADLIMDGIKRSMHPATIKEVRIRRIILNSGLEFRFIAVEEIDMIRGLNLGAVLVNCPVDKADSALIASHVRAP